MLLFSSTLLTSVEDDADIIQVEAAQRYCIGPDGDHRLSWTLLERDGFNPLDPSDFVGVRTPGIHATSLRGFQKTVRGQETRVMTAATWLRVPDQGQTFYRWCWVYSSSGSRDAVTADIAERLGVRSFRSEKVRVFAWIPRPGGVSVGVSRQTHIREGNILAREQGMRQLIVRRLDRGVSIGYASPRDEATYRGFDWSGPDPVPAPQ